jgi:hypothetical protein
METSVAWKVIGLDFDGTDTLLVLISDGHRTIEILADVELGNRYVVLRGLHIQGAGPNSMGPGTLLGLIRWQRIG